MFFKKIKTPNIGEYIKSQNEQSRMKMRMQSAEDYVNFFIYFGRFLQWAQNTTPNSLELKFGCKK